MITVSSHEFQTILRDRTVEVEIGVYTPRFEGTFGEPPQEEHCEFEVFDMDNNKLSLTEEESVFIHSLAILHLKNTTREGNYY